MRDVRYKNQQPQQHVPGVITETRLIDDQFVGKCFDNRFNCRSPNLQLIKNMKDNLYEWDVLYGIYNLYLIYIIFTWIRIKVNGQVRCKPLNKELDNKAKQVKHKHLTTMFHVLVLRCNFLCEPL